VLIYHEWQSAQHFTDKGLWRIASSGHIDSTFSPEQSENMPYALPPSKESEHLDEKRGSVRL
jgi:hypothetical protein